MIAWSFGQGVRSRGDRRLQVVREVYLPAVGWMPKSSARGCNAFRVLMSDSAAEGDE